MSYRDGDDLPLTRDQIERTALVADCVVAPEMTRLLTLAQASDRPIHTGVPILSSQMELMLRFMGVDLV